MECSLRPSTADSLADALRSQLSPELVAALSQPDQIAALLACAGDGSAEPAVADAMPTRPSTDMSRSTTTDASTSPGHSRGSSVNSLHTALSTPPPSRRGSKSAVDHVKPVAVRQASTPASPVRRVPVPSRPVISPRRSSLYIEMPLDTLPASPSTPPPGPPSPSEGAIRVERTPSKKWRQSVLHAALSSFVAASPRKSAPSSPTSPAPAAARPSPHLPAFVASPPCSPSASPPRTRRLSISPRIIGESLVAPSPRGIGSADGGMRRQQHRRSSSFPIGAGVSSADLPPALDEDKGEGGSVAAPLETLASAAVIGLQERLRAHEEEERNRWTAIRRRRASHGASSALHSALDVTPSSAATM